MTETDSLCLPNWEITGVEKNTTEISIQAKHLLEPTNCPKCGFSVIYRHGLKRIQYRDTPIGWKKVMINATLQRYRCQKCLNTFNQPVTGIHSGMRVTERCYKFICDQYEFTTTYKLADLIGVHRNTISKITKTLPHKALS